MCGILFGASKIDTAVDDEEAVKGFIAARGPDSVKEFKLDMGNCFIRGISSVLHMRGEETVVQPLQSSRFLLQWNGEIFAFDGQPLAGNDTQFLFERLSELPQVQELSEFIAVLMARIQGPWAMVLVDKLHERVYFGRDCFGRRSLLFDISNDALMIASCAIEGREAEAGRLYCFDLVSWNFQPLLPLPLRPWIISPEYSISDADALIQAAWKEFEGSVARRILHLPRDKDLSILFSGGVDSMLIAVACCRLLSRCKHPQPLSLVNVAFEHPGQLKLMKLNEPTAEYWSSIPDRQGGLEGCHELQRLFPEIQLRWRECNVRRVEYDGSRARVRRLMAPNDTVMDLSLAMVIWHGSQQASSIDSAIEEGASIDKDESASIAGTGSIPPSTTLTTPTTPSTHRRRPAVLLCGMGADEQLGGYSRHRSLIADPSALRAELQLDLDRISTRNLGRDDRCIGDSGMEGRFPFLDEQFVSFVSEGVPLEAKIDKWLVRQMLRVAGVRESLAGRPKKAMQFGAKSAKIEGNCIGTDTVD